MARGALADAPGVRTARLLLTGVGSTVGDGVGAGVEASGDADGSAAAARPGMAIIANAAPKRLVRTSRRRTAPKVVDVARVRMARLTLDHWERLAPA